MTTRTTRVHVTVAALALASLTACGESADQTTREPSTVTVTTGAEGTGAAQASTAAPAAPAAPAAGELPAAVTDYTQEARAEMAEEGVTEADVEAALAAAHNGEAEVEWDDGYWEIEWRDIDVDINADGVVLDADR